MAHEGLGDTGIDAIHRHVIAIVGGPTESKFGEVSRADDDGILTIGHIHE